MSKKTAFVAPYNPTWPLLFQKEATHIRRALGENFIDVLHIGSTSIPGMSAKPIIDMIPVVKDIYKVNESAMEKLGYTCRGELGMMFRHFCQKITPNLGYHAHIWEKDSAEIHKNLLFRQHLINHPHDFRAYESLKIQLAGEFHEDRNAYTLNKDDLIKSIIAEAGFNERTIVQALTPHEWKHYTASARNKFLMTLASYMISIIPRLPKTNIFTLF